MIIPNTTLSESIVSPSGMAHHPVMPQPETIFLTAEWRWLAMLNYEIDPQALASFVPAGTELDFWNGKTYVSLVGFLFQDCRVRGIAIPFHRHFEEINLRFYVRHKANDGWRRGVVFIKELVPRWTIAFIARTLYNENYFALPMSHRIENAKNTSSLSPAFVSSIDDVRPMAVPSPLPYNGRGEGQGEVRVPINPISLSYSWRFDGRENHMKVTTRGTPQVPADGSQPEFITEHYWGYARQRDGSTMEYRVEHPRWQIWETASAEVDCDIANLYGKNFCEFLDCPPASAFLADGSAIKVYKGSRLKP
jgi:hypothetical protein